MSEHMLEEIQSFVDTTSLPEVLEALEATCEGRRLESMDANDEDARVYWTVARNDVRGLLYKLERLQEAEHIRDGDHDGKE